MMNIDKQTVRSLFRRLAQEGHAPKEGCELFGAGYQDVFTQLIDEYVEGAFSSGDSAEKFVIGPYGSGKTHFLRHFSTLCRQRNCVTVEVELNKNIDYTKPLILYKEFARRIQAPNSSSHGIKNLLKSTIKCIEANAPIGIDVNEFIHSWIDALAEQDFELQQFVAVLQKALDAYIADDRNIFNTTSRWLAGEIDNRNLIKAMPKDLYMAPVSSAEHKLFARDMMLSLCQFCKNSPFKGTIVCYDEAEQGFDVGKKKQHIILSMLQSEINSIAALEGGAVMLIFAVTPDVAEHFDEFAALQQRIEDPGANMSFFDGNILAPKIDLTYRPDPRAELVEMGNKLVDLFFDAMGDEIQIKKACAKETVEEYAENLLETQAESSNRRMMVKRTCAFLNSQLKSSVSMNVASEDKSEEAEA